MLISFEGIDGCGKSTQIQLLKDKLIAQGKIVQVFREPGGTSLSEAIRALLLDKTYDPEPVTELLLFSSARSQLIQQEVIPALDRGEIVILDRFYDSTTAYQGYGRSVLPIEQIQDINTVASHGLKPDITFYLRITVEDSFKRTERFEKDRMESAGEEFFKRVIQGYDTLVAEESRFHVLEGNKMIASIADEILTSVEAKLSED